MNRKLIYFLFICVLSKIQIHIIAKNHIDNISLYQIIHVDKKRGASMRAWFSVSLFLLLITRLQAVQLYSFDVCKGIFVDTMQFYFDHEPKIQVRTEQKENQNILHVYMPDAEFIENNATKARLDDIRMLGGTAYRVDIVDNAGNDKKTCITIVSDNKLIFCKHTLVAAPGIPPILTIQCFHKNTLQFMQDASGSVMRCCSYCDRIKAHYYCGSCAPCLFKICCWHHDTAKAMYAFF